MQFSEEKSCGFGLGGRGTSDHDFTEPPGLGTLTPTPALVALLYLCETWSRRRLLCQSNVFWLSDWTASSSAIGVLSSPVGAVWSDRQTPLETRGSSAAGRLDDFSTQSNSPERKRFAHTVWLQSGCLCIYKCPWRLYVLMLGKWLHEEEYKSDIGWHLQIAQTKDTEGRKLAAATVHWWHDLQTTFMVSCFYWNQPSARWWRWRHFALKSLCHQLLNQSGETLTNNLILVCSVNTQVHIKRWLILNRLPEEAGRRADGDAVKVESPDLYVDHTGTWRQLNWHMHNQ